MKKTKKDNLVKHLKEVIHNKTLNTPRYKNNQEMYQDFYSKR